MSVEGRKLERDESVHDVQGKLPTGSGHGNRSVADISFSESRFHTTTILPSDTAALTLASVTRTARDYADLQRSMYAPPASVLPDLLRPDLIRELYREPLDPHVTNPHIQIERILLPELIPVEIVELNLATGFSYQGIRVRGPVFISALAQPIGESGLSHADRVTVIATHLRAAMYEADTNDVSLVAFPYYSGLTDGATYQALSQPGLALPHVVSGDTYTVVGGSAYFYFAHGSGDTREHNTVAAKRLMTDEQFIDFTTTLRTRWSSFARPLLQAARANNNPDEPEESANHTQFLIQAALGCSLLTNDNSGDIQ